MAHVTLHLWRVPLRHLPQALWRMGVDRWRLRDTAGLTFAKLLGTGDGRTFDVRDADPTLWGLLACWQDRQASLAFEAHATPRGWRRIATEEWRGDLVCVRARGAWSRRQPFVVEASSRRAETGGAAGPSGQPVAAITRARLRPAAMVPFWRTVPSVVADLTAGAAPLARVGIGEAPVGLQGTFTVWRSAEDLAAFAYGRSPHRAAIAATHEQGFYAEECFARFVLQAERGTLQGGRVVP